MRYAGFWKRVLAYCIDGVVLQIALVLVILLLPERADAPAFDMLTFQHAMATDPVLAQQQLHAWLGSLFDPRLIVATLILSAAYNILLVASPYQATLGKRYYKLRVVTREGARLSLVQSALRHVACLASLAPMLLGFLLPIVHRQKAALHDVIVGTRVIVEEKP